MDFDHGFYISLIVLDDVVDYEVWLVVVRSPTCCLVGGSGGLVCCGDCVVRGCRSLVSGCRGLVCSSRSLVRSRGCRYGQASTTGNTATVNSSSKIISVIVEMRSSNNSRY